MRTIDKMHIALIVAWVAIIVSIVLNMEPMTLEEAALMMVGISLMIIVGAVKVYIIYDTSKDTLC